MKVKSSEDAENDDGWKEVTSLMTSLSSYIELGTELPTFRMLFKPLFIRYSVAGSQKHPDWYACLIFNDMFLFSVSWKEEVSGILFPQTCHLVSLILITTLLHLLIYLSVHLIRLWLREEIMTVWCTIVVLVPIM